MKDQRNRPGKHGIPVSVRLPRDLHAKLVEYANEKDITGPLAVARLLDLAFLVAPLPGLLDFLIAFGSGDERGAANYLINRNTPNGAPNDDERLRRRHEIEKALMDPANRPTPSQDEGLIPLGRYAARLPRLEVGDLNKLRRILGDDEFDALQERWRKVEEAEDDPHTELVGLRRLRERGPPDHPPFQSEEPDRAIRLTRVRRARCENERR